MLVQACLRGGFLAALAQIICFSTADGNADREHREEMLAKDSDGLASPLLYARRLICILGAGRNADGVSREAVLSFAGFRPGMQSLVPVNLRTFDQRYLEKGRVSSALCTRWLPCCSGANYISAFLPLTETQIDIASGRNVGQGQFMGWRPCYCIPDGSSAFWELTKMQIDFPGKLCCHLLASGRACSLWWP